MNFIYPILENALQYNFSDIFGFAVKGAYQKRHKTIVHLQDYTALELCNKMRNTADSKCLVLFCNYLHAMRLSNVHHKYGDYKINALNIFDPLALENIEYGQIGSLNDIPIYFSRSTLADKFPPILINSKTAKPILIELLNNQPETWSVKNISIYPDSVFANCGQLVEQQLRVSLSAHDNMEAYKRFMNRLSNVIMENRDGKNEERSG